MNHIQRFYMNKSEIHNNQKYSQSHKSHGAPYAPLVAGDLDGRRRPAAAEDGLRTPRAPPAHQRRPPAGALRAPCSLAVARAPAPTAPLPWGRCPPRRPRAGSGPRCRGFRAPAAAKEGLRAPCAPAAAGKAPFALRPRARQPLSRAFHGRSERGEGRER